MDPSRTDDNLVFRDRINAPIGGMMVSANSASAARPMPEQHFAAVPLAPAKPNGGCHIRRRRPGGWRRGRLFRRGRCSLDIVRCRGRERISKARMRRYQNCGKSNCRESKTEHVTSPVGKCRKRLCADERRVPRIPADISEAFHIMDNAFTGLCPLIGPLSRWRRARRPAAPRKHSPPSGTALRP